MKVKDFYFLIPILSVNFLEELEETEDQLNDDESPQLLEAAVKSIQHNETVKKTLEVDESIEIQNESSKSETSDKNRSASPWDLLAWIGKFNVKN